MKKNIFGTFILFAFISLPLVINGCTSSPPPSIEYLNGRFELLKIDLKLQAVKLFGEIGYFHGPTDASNPYKFRTLPGLDYSFIRGIGDTDNDLFELFPGPQYSPDDQPSHSRLMAKTKETLTAREYSIRVAWKSDGIDFSEETSKVFTFIILGEVPEAVPNVLSGTAVAHVMDVGGTLRYPIRDFAIKFTYYNRYVSNSNECIITTDLPAPNDRLTLSRSSNTVGIDPDEIIITGLRDGQIVNWTATVAEGSIGIMGSSDGSSGRITISGLPPQ